MLAPGPNWPQPVSAFRRGMLTRWITTARLWRYRTRSTARFATSHPSRDLTRQGWQYRDYTQFVDQAAAHLATQIEAGAYNSTLAVLVTGFSGHTQIVNLGPYDSTLTPPLAGIDSLDQWTDLSLAVATGWLAAFLTTTHHGPNGLPWWSSADRITLPYEWAPECLGVLGPLAWAAGLTVEEALAQHADGELTDTALRMLVALRWPARTH